MTMEKFSPFYLQSMNEPTVVRADFRHINSVNEADHKLRCLLSPSVLVTKLDSGDSGPAS